MKDLPMVSIVIPVFNGSDYLSSAIDSALAQDYSNLEVIVVNDGSSDDSATENVARGYGDRIRYFSKNNGGVASALNLGISVMRGDYFSWLSHDDLYQPFKVSHQVALLRNAGFDKAVAYSAACAFDTDPDVCIPIPVPGGKPEWFRFFLATDSSLHGCTLLVPKSAFLELGGFDEKLKTTQDYDMWFRLAAAYDFIGTSEVVVKARQHDAQGTVTMKDTVRRECDELICRFIDEMSSCELEASGLRVADAYLKLAKVSYRRGLMRSAREALSKGSRAPCVTRSIVRVQGEGLCLLRFLRARLLK